MHEAINAGDNTNGSVSQTAESIARLGLTGTYHAICRGFKGMHEAEFLAEFPRLLAMRQELDRLCRATVDFSGSRVAAFMVELEKFEQYMDSLTEVKWAQNAPNVVTTVGANSALDTIFSGSAYSVTGPFMGLIGAVSFTSAPVIADTMASHAGWTEAGGVNAPTYTGPRKTIAWSAASAKSKVPSAAPVFAITGTGTAKGVFLVYGASAVSTLDSTAGVLYSGGLFTGGDQAVVNTNTLTVSYTATA